MSLPERISRRRGVAPLPNLLAGLLLLGLWLLVGCSSRAVKSDLPPPLVLQPTSVTTPSATPTPEERPEVFPEKVSIPPFRSGNTSGELVDLREAILRTPFTVPIVGAALPLEQSLLPGAARPYRRGIHQGIDFYYDRNGRTVTTATGVVAAKTGTVIRADWDYREPTQSEMDWLLDITKERGYTPEDVLDRLRGRQVWLDHGYGIITRYAHLDRLAPGVVVGRVLQEGEVLGYTGNSGSPDAATGLESDIHLHFEIRVGDRYFGQGLETQDIIELMPRVFTPSRRTTRNS